MAYKSGIRLYKDGQSVTMWNANSYNNYISWGYSESKPAPVVALQQ